MTEPIASRMRRNAGRVCQLPNCYRPVRRIGAHCTTHDSNIRDRGHPTASNITRGELRHCLKDARKFVDHQSKLAHPGILGAITLIERWGAGASIPSALHRGSSSVTRWNAWLYRFHREKLDAADVVAVAIACYWHRADFPVRYPSDHFFTFQLGKHVTALTGRVRVRTGLTSERTERRPSGLLVTAGRELERNLGVLFIRSAEHLRRQRPTEDRALIAALVAPFSSVPTEPL